MWPFKKILFAFDGCPECQAARAAAPAIGRKFGSELVLLPSRESAGAILSAADSQKAGLILLARHSRPGRLPDPLLDGVLANARCPVLVVPASALEWEVAGPVLCALKVNEDDGAAACACAIARAYGVPVHLLHAVPDLQDRKLRLKLFESAWDRLLGLRRKVAASAALSVQAGEVAKVLERAALTSSASLVVIGRGHVEDRPGYFSRRSYDLIRNAGFPVLVAGRTSAGHPLIERRCAA